MGAMDGMGRLRSRSEAGAEDSTAIGDSTSSRSKVDAHNAGVPIKQASFVHSFDSPGLPPEVAMYEYDESEVGAQQGRINDGCTIPIAETTGGLQDSKRQALDAEDSQSRQRRDS